MDLFLHTRSNLHTEDPLTDSYGDYQNMTIPDYETGNEYDIHVPFVVFVMNLVFTILILLVACPFFIFILAKPELRKTPTCWFVINVLVVVLLMGFVYFPFVMHNVFTFRSGVIGCHFGYIMFAFCTVHTQFSLLLLFIDRFVYLVRPTRHPEIMTPRVVRIMIICLTIVELILSLTCIYTLMKPGINKVHGETLCHGTGYFTFYTIYGLIIHVLPVFLNVVFCMITICCGLALCRRLRTSGENKGSLGGQAIGLILTIVFLDMGFILPEMLNDLFATHYNVQLWLVFRGLSLTFLFAVNFPMMFLIPEIRSALTSICKSEKNGEKMPLVKPTQTPG